MWKQIAVSGVVGAAILGTGAAALAESTSGTPTPSASTSSSTGSAGAAGAKPAGTLGGRLKLALGRFDHGEWVAQGKTATAPVTHDAVKGTVTAVSATSISVKSADGFSETFVVNGTAVRVKGTKGKAAITAVKVNDTALVAGTKSGSTVTALHVLDGGAK